MEPQTMTVELNLLVKPALPEVTSTPEDRLQALRDAKELLITGGSTEGGVAQALFGKSTQNKGGDQYPDPHPLFRVAEYITTGHDYLDTHPDQPDNQELRDVIAAEVRKAQRKAAKKAAKKAQA